MINNEDDEFLLDPEWIELMVIARNMGLEPNEIRSFLISCMERL